MSDSITNNPLSEIPNPQSNHDNLNPEPQTLNPPPIPSPEPQTPNPPAPAPSPQSPAPNRRRRGRPRRLDDAKRREVCALISTGCGIPAAARYVGCAASTIHRESLRNDDFREQLRRSSLAAALSPLNAVRHAANSHWRAAAWLLERIDPERFVKLKPKMVKFEHLSDMVDTIVDTLVKEVHDPETRRRIIRRFEEGLAQIEREVSAQNEYFRTPSRGGRPAARSDQSASWPVDQIP